jgi:hypothetical protein
MARNKTEKKQSQSKILLYLDDQSKTVLSEVRSKSPVPKDWNRSSWIRQAVLEKYEREKGGCK